MSVCCGLQNACSKVSRKESGGGVNGRRTSVYCELHMHPLKEYCWLQDR